MTFHPSNTAINMFSGCNRLEYVKIYGTQVDISFKWSSYIMYDTVKYLIYNAANTSPITITVHSTTYSYLMGTAEPTEQVGDTTEEWQALVTTATEKQITFASA